MQETPTADDGYITRAEFAQILRVLFTETTDAWLRAESLRLALEARGQVDQGEIDARFEALKAEFWPKVEAQLAAWEQASSHAALLSLLESRHTRPQ